MISPEEFKIGMRCLGGAVTIVAAADQDRRAGLTATAVTSLSDEPPRLLACINRKGSSFEICSSGRVMSINVLSAKDQALALRFAGLDGTPETERFLSGQWVESPLGVPYLVSSLVSFVCSVDDIIDTGSHGIVIGLIKEIHVNAKNIPPLAYLDGAWATFSPLSL